MVIEDLIPKALLAALEQEQKSLVYVDGSWATVANSSLLINSNLVEINQKLDQLLEKAQNPDKKF